MSNKRLLLWIVPVSLVSVIACSKEVPQATSYQAPPEAVIQVINSNPVLFHAGNSLTTFTSDDFSGSGMCSVCHTGLKDDGGNDVSIDGHWRSTIMANASRDPFWLAKVSSEITRIPALKEEIEDKCANCHMPMAHTQAVVSGKATGILGSGFLNQDNALSAAAMDGVSCTVCHQIKDSGLGTKGTFSGKYPIDTATTPPDRLLYGPFADSEQQTMRDTTGFTPLQGRQIEDAGLCATCHTLYTPYIDSQGEVAGELPEQTAFLEWKASDYGDGTGEDKICQHCHMPGAEGGVVISTLPAGLEKRSPFGQHHFVGGNAFMVKLLQANIEKLGVTASTDRLRDTLQRTIEQLNERTASISIQETKVINGELTAAIEIKNKAGHKLPTGFPSRQMWIHLRVVDATGRTVFESGKPRPDGNITGNDADTDILAFEPHYTVISDPEQVQIYQSVMEDTDRKITYTLLRGAGYRKDNRLLPAGFDKKTASPDIAVYGHAAEDTDFKDGGDSIVYRINVKGYPGPFTINAELLYQSISPAFIRDLRTDRTPEIDAFLGYYNATRKEPALISLVVIRTP